MHMGRNSDDLRKTYPALSMAPAPLFSSTKQASLKTVGRTSRMDVLWITFALKKTTPIAFASLSALVELTSQATAAHQQT
eukprot:CCRYP_017166-RA/>CCRYP_017166-RA protein AED:0.46 eAED:0.46 QI:0/-1/0/1/-1/0/1/0/79